MKKIIFLLIFLIACKKSSKTTVDFWHVMGGPLGKRLDEMIADFNKLHPEGEVKSVHMGSYDVLAQKLMGAVASNNPPVIAQMYESWTDQFYQAGVLHPMRNFVVADTGFNLDDFFSVFIIDNTFDSVLVTLPFNKSVPVFYYNEDILRRHGYSQFPKNWKDFRKACRVLKTENIWPTSWPVDVWYFSTMLYQEDGQLYDEFQKRPCFQKDEGVQVLQYLVSLVEDSLLYLNPGFQRQVEFVSEKVATIPASVVSWAFMKGNTSFTMKVAPFPHGKNKATVIAGTNIGMFENTTPAQKKLAWAFVKWFLQPENQVRWTKASFYLPTRKSTLSLVAFQNFIEENKGYDKIVEQLYVARTEPRVAEWFTGRIYLNEAMEEAMRLERTPQDALDYAAKRLAIEAFE